MRFTDPATTANDVITHSADYIVPLVLNDQRGYSGKSEIYFIGLDSFFTNVYYLWSHMDKTSVRIDYPVESCKIAV